MKTIVKGLFAVIVILLTACSKSGSDIDLSLYPVKIGESFQYINKKGEVVINPQFAEASIFSNGLARVKTSGDDGKYGYIDKKGEFVIQPTYIQATTFNEGIAWVVTPGGAPTAINMKGEILFTLKEAEWAWSFVNGVAIYATINDKDEPQYGAVNTKGEVVISPQFKFLSYLMDGRAFIKDEKGKFGFLDEEGKIVVNYQFDAGAYFLNSDRVPVAFGDKWGVINREGKYTINPQFSFVDVDGKWFLIKQNGKCGWCDDKGKIVINPQFEKSKKFLNSDLAPVYSGNQWGYINKEGKIVINPQFENALPFNDGVAWVQSNNKFGLIDIEGKFVVNPQYDGIANELAAYILDNNIATFLGGVKTDYFDVELITKNIEKLIANDKIDNMESTVTYGELLSKYQKSQANINLKNELELKEEKISGNGMSLTLFALGGNLFSKVSDGWFGYTNVFNPNASPNAFAVKIKLGEKGIGKEEIAYNAIEKLLGGQGTKKGAYEVKISGETNTGCIFILFSKTGLDGVSADDFPTGFHNRLDEAKALADSIRIADSIAAVEQAAAEAAAAAAQ